MYSCLRILLNADSESAGLGEMLCFSRLLGHAGGPLLPGESMVILNFSMPQENLKDMQQVVGPFSFSDSVGLM